MMRYEKLSLTLVSKLASIVVHVEEFLSAGYCLADLKALEPLLEDSEVKAWIIRQQAAGLAPVKR